MIPIPATCNYPFGIEEEFFLSHAESGALAINGARAVLEGARASLGECVTAEMLQSQIEISTPVFEHIDGASQGLTGLRRSLSDIARSLDLRLIAAGTHPLGVWHEQVVAEERRYEELLADFRIVGHRNLVCGLHVHVGIPPGVDRVDLMNRLMRWLPLFLALSASSPFWNARVSGLLSYRQALYDEWPRSGVPDFFRDEADYSAFTERMKRAGAIRDSRDIWWAMRPAARFPTLELRIADVCTRVEDSVALAALFRCLVAAAIRHPGLGRMRTTHTRRIIDENRWRAKRDGIRAHFIGEASSELRSVAQVLERTLTVISDAAEELECEHVLGSLTDIVRRGTSADEQLRIYNQSREIGMDELAALRRVLAWLETATVPEPVLMPAAPGRRASYATQPS
jgi:glutamate---cysteine ligase / carboxylate-amine ligase